MLELVRHRLWPQVGSCLMPGADNPRMSSWYRRRTKEGGSPGSPAPPGISGRTAERERARLRCSQYLEEEAGGDVPIFSAQGSHNGCGQIGPILAVRFQIFLQKNGPGFAPAFRAREPGPKNGLHEPVQCKR